MLKSKVVDISRQGVFLQSDVESLLPVIIKITAGYSSVVEGLISRLEALNSEQADLIKELESEINDLIQDWHVKIKKLGGLPKGLWLVDFDSGDGYFGWQYPEAELGFWHGYNDGFSKRVALKDKPISTVAPSKPVVTEVFPTI